MPVVADYCSHETVTVKREQSLLDAAGLMRDKQVGCVVVVEDGADGVRRPVGILTDRDIVVRVLAQTDRQLHLLRVDDVMTRDPAHASETDDLSETLMTMRAEGVRRIPVVSPQGDLVGLLSFDDILDYIQQEVTDLACLVDGGRHGNRSGRQ